MSLARVTLWAAPIAWMTFIFFLSAQPDPADLFPVPLNVDDKVIHLLLYAALGLLLWRAARGGGVRRLERRPGGWALAIGSIYGLSDEFHQAFVPQRSADLADLITDGIGLALGIAIVWVWRTLR